MKAEIDVIFRGIKDGFSVFDWERWGWQSATRVPVSKIPPTVLEKLGRLPPGAWVTVSVGYASSDSKKELRITRITGEKVTRMRLTEVHEGGVMFEDPSGKEADTYCFFDTYPWLKGRFSEQDLEDQADLEFIYATERGALKRPLLIDVGELITDDRTDVTGDSAVEEVAAGPPSGGPVPASTSGPVPPPPPPRSGNGGATAKEPNGSPPPPVTPLPTPTGVTRGVPPGAPRAAPLSPPPPRPGAPAPVKAAGSGQGNLPPPPPPPRATPPKGIAVAEAGSSSGSAGGSLERPSGTPPLPVTPPPPAPTGASGAESPIELDASASADDGLEEWLQTGGKLPLPRVR